MATRRPTATTQTAQIALFGSPETAEPFRKATQILHSTPQMPLSLLQRKLMDAMIKNAIQNEADPKGMWEISIVRLAQDVGFDSNNREYLIDSARAFMRIIFEWDVMAPAKVASVYKASVLVPEIEIHPNCVRYAISSHLRDVMMNPEIYAVVDQSVGRKFRRGAAYAIWQFCCRYERIGQTATMRWEHFRDMILGQDSTSVTYDQYKFFKNKVLNPSIAEINEISPLEVTLREGKEGKRVIEIQFVVTRKTVEPKLASSQDDESRALIGEMVLLRVSPAEARKILRTRTIDEIKAAVAYVKRRVAQGAVIREVGAYFRAALEGRYAEGPVEDVQTASGAPESGSSTPAPSPATPNPAKELLARYQAKRQDDAENLYRGLSQADREDLIKRYNAQQSVPILQMSDRVTRANLVAFARWMVLELWGKPSDQELANFALASAAAAEQRTVSAI